MNASFRFLSARKGARDIFGNEWPFEKGFFFPFGLPDVADAGQTVAYTFEAVPRRSIAGWIRMGGRKDDVDIICVTDAVVALERK
ncbi:hypothetical protein Trydic_g19627 [Trypoxylus dichotomus]